MSRDEKVTVVETFLRCIASKDLARLPVDAALTLQSPLTPKVGGPAAMAYLKRLAAGVNAIHVRQHIVEGDWVVTLFDEETTNGSLLVLARFQVASGRIKHTAHTDAFYDPRLIIGATR